MAKKYTEAFLRLFEEINSINKIQNKYFDFNNIAHIFQVLESQFRENQILIGQKIKEPSHSKTITSVQQYIDEINEEIKNSNKKIEEHNNLLKNIKLEQSNIIQDIWTFLSEENKTSIDSFSKKSVSIENALNGIKSNISQKKNFRNKEIDEIIKNEEKITSISHSINEINRILLSFGFKNFKLADAGKGNYKIVREDGRDAEATLSEGEKTFITFLYFYQLITL